MINYPIHQGRYIMKGERVAQLELLLRSHPEGLRRAEIARRLGVHRSTISRYVEELATKIELYEENNLIKIKPKDDVTTEQLSIYESLAFNMSAEMLVNNLDIQNPHLASGLRKLGMNMWSYAPKIANNVMELADQIDKSIEERKNENSTYNKILEVLIDCWVSGRIARIIRMDGDNAEEIEIAPYFIGFKDEVTGRVPITVTGRLRHTTEIITLDISKISNAIMLDETYTIPDNLKPFKNNPEKDSYDAIDMIPLTLKVKERSALNSFSTIIHGKIETTKQADGSYHCSFSAENSIELMLRIIQSGTSVEIISPDSYRNKVIKYLESILKIYK